MERKNKVKPIWVFATLYPDSGFATTKNGEYPNYQQWLRLTDNLKKKKKKNLSWQLGF